MQERGCECLYRKAAVNGSHRSSPPPSRVWKNETSKCVVHLRLEVRKSREDIAKAIGWPTKATRWAALRMYEGGLLVGSAWAWPDSRKPARHKCSFACWAGGKLHDADLDSCSWPSCELRRQLRARLSPPADPVAAAAAATAACWMPSSGCFSTSARTPVYVYSRRLPTCGLHHFLPDIGAFSPARLHKRGRAISSRPCMASAESGCQRWADRIGQWQQHLGIADAGFSNHRAPVLPLCF